MKLFFAAVFSLMTFVSAAQAKDVPLIELSGEGTRVRIPLGVQVSDYNPRQLQAIYYYDDYNRRQPFAIDTLRNMTVVYKYKRKYDAAALQLAVATSDSYTLTIRFLRNGIKDTYDTTQIRLKYNAQAARWEAINPENGRVVTQAHIIPNKVFAIGMVGIADLQLR